MATAKEILKYIESFENEAENGYESTIHLNDSILHACVILKELFRKALKEPERTVNMFCGSFSLFRDETSKIIEDEKRNCSTDGLDDAQKDAWAKLDLFKNLQDELREFISNNGKLNLIIQKAVDTLRNNTVWTSLDHAILDGRVKIYYLEDSIGLDHFAVTYEAYRIENSDKNKTAICCFSDRKTGLVLNNSFSFLRQSAVSVF